MSKELCVSFMVSPKHFQSGNAPSLPVNTLSPFSALGVMPSFAKNLASQRQIELTSRSMETNS
jgi:hypothetical protein